MENEKVLLDILRHNNDEDRFQINAILLDDINVALPIPELIFKDIYLMNQEVCFIWVLSGQSKKWMKFIKKISKKRFIKVTLKS
jgi:hypothetical protein